MDEEVIKLYIDACQYFQKTKEQAIETLIRRFNVEEQEAINYVEKYWR